MDIELSEAIQNCFNTNFNPQSPSYQWIEALKNKENYIEVSLSLCLSSQPLALRQFAAILVKNHTKSWIASDSLSNLDLPQQMTLKNSILSCLKLSVPDLVRNQFEEIFFSVFCFKALDHNIIKQLKEYLLSSNIDLIYASFVAINYLVKAYKKDPEGIMNQLVTEDSFIDTSLILKVLKQLENYSVELKWEIIYVALKIFYNMIHGDLFMRDHINTHFLSGWLEIVKIVLDINSINMDTQGHNECTGKPKEFITRCQKICFKIVYKLAYSYFDPQILNHI